ncbi:MAG: precorrin-4 C(11)-methyltransferase [Synergistaceae bacterium]|nr:precorrin-4 C(11)-methyltransferase [Synergistaceae bacterium]
MIYFIGAGPGAVDLITVRGAEILKKAGMIIYAGSLVNPELLNYADKANCEIYNSASMTLDEVMEKLIDGHERGLVTVRLHTGDPSLYGAIREQIDILREKNIEFKVIPGERSFFAAAAAVQAEYTLPDVSQTVIISRMEGRTPVPERESIKNLASHKSSMVLFLSSGMLKALSGELIAGGYDENTPAALVYKASWPDEKIIRTNLKDLASDAEAAGINKTALVLFGEFLNDKEHNNYKLSKLYDEKFSHGFRQAKA